MHKRQVKSLYPRLYTYIYPLKLHRDIRCLKTSFSAQKFSHRDTFFKVFPTNQKARRKKSLLLLPDVPKDSIPLTTLSHCPVLTLSLLHTNSH